MIKRKNQLNVFFAPVPRRIHALGDLIGVVSRRNLINVNLVFVFWLVFGERFEECLFLLGR
jgi:hypothetical protein